MDEYKLPWQLTFLLSIVYLISFAVAALKDSAYYYTAFLDQWDSGLLLGFCVWGAPMPTDEAGCHDHEPLNSHNFAFLVDMGMMVLTAQVWRKDSVTRRGGLPWGYTIVYAAFLLICLVHGIAHCWLFASFIDCYQWIDLPGPLLFFGYAVLVVLVFLIAFVCFKSILRFQQQAWLWSLGVALFTAVLIYFVVARSGSYWSIQCVFAVTHPLAWYYTRPTFQMPITLGSKTRNVVGAL